MAQTYFNDLKCDRYKPIGKEEEQELLCKAKEGDEIARQRILEANVRFVFDIAKKYKNKGVPLTELIAEGNMGLIKAMEKFDMNRNVKFITYAVWWVKNYMCTLIEARIKNNDVEYADALSRTNDGNPQLYDEEDTYDFEYDGTYDAMDEENSEERYGVIDTLMSNIAPREREVIIAYFGIGDHQPKTLQEIADEMNVSSERVRQIKVIALRKMKTMALAYSMAEKI